MRREERRCSCCCCCGSGAWPLFAVAAGKSSAADEEVESAAPPLLLLLLLSFGGELARVAGGTFSVVIFVLFLGRSLLQEESEVERRKKNSKSIRNVVLEKFILHSVSLVRSEETESVDSRSLCLSLSLSS